MASTTSSDPALQGVKAPDPNNNAIPPELVSKFDPIFVENYTKYNVGKLAAHQVPIEDFRADPAKYSIEWGRKTGPEVHRITDLKCPVDGGEITVRVYEPAPAVEGVKRGVHVNFHGGGWVLGNLLQAEQSLRQVVMETGVVAFDVDYRLAPEYKYPTQVDDSWAAYQWILKTQVIPFNLDPARFSVGGDSAGGHLAAVIALLARDHSVPLALQLLTVPSTDLTASLTPTGDFLGDTTPYKSYHTLAHTQPLDLSRMQYFSKHWLDGAPVPFDAADWKISPMRAKSLRGVAPAVVFVAEVDILREEGEAYAKRLREEGVETEVVLAKGAPHTVKLLDAITDGGRLWVDTAVRSLRKYCGDGATSE